MTNVVTVATPEQAIYSQMRTVWHCLYDQHSGSVELSFYLGEDAKGAPRTER